MSTNVTKSRFAWIGTAVEAVGFVIFCGFIGIGITLACFTAAETVVDTRNNAGRMVELEKRIDALEEQARPKGANTLRAGALTDIQAKPIDKDLQP
jgi:hypothetical protein